MKRKGMSQILALIVAAMVLMMTALTVIFMAQGTLGDFGDSVNSQGCLGTINTQCSVQGTPNIDVPSVCMNDGQATQALTNNGYDPADDDGDGTQEITCQ